MKAAYDFVFLGLSLSSSWGNGHATTFRSLIRGLAARGQRVLFLERDVPWYAEARDLENPDFCTLDYYSDIEDLLARHRDAITAAKAVIVGSYVPAGVAVLDVLHALKPKRLCFYDIDTPVTLSKLDRGDEEYIAKRQFPMVDIYFSFAGGPVLSWLEKALGVKQAVALYCSVDAERYQPTGEPISWDLGYLGTYSRDRQPVLERLLIEPARRLPDKRFIVAGPQYPGDIDWPDNVDRIDHLPPADHPSFYSRQRFTLNVTRADMVALGWSPSVRLFEAAACETPIISDNWQGLTDFFSDGDEIRIATDSDEVVRILTETSEADRMAQAKAAARRVAERHTGLARADEFLAALEREPALTAKMLSAAVQHRQHA
ncbi:glycosyltransferase [Peteryoungia desertarenae]|uniref:Glycosyltransferase n=1 Tax=Peteryoungia desertarenae TaxID=1813451 RepID=A0ABX6QL42_9HYPH|nr:glycosyltransferase [Peteryoungia desertarenae]QLF68940.1 glycosyltransferase [Peteryoungia desertarenae]